VLILIREERPELNTLTAVTVQLTTEEGNRVIQTTHILSNVWSFDPKGNCNENLHFSSVNNRILSKWRC